MKSYKIEWVVDGQKRNMKMFASSKKVADNIAKQYLLEKYTVRLCK